MGSSSADTRALKRGSEDLRHYPAPLARPSVLIGDEVVRVVNRSLGALVAFSAALAVSLAGCGNGGATTATTATATTENSASSSALGGESATSATTAALNPALSAALLSPEDMKEAFKSTPQGAATWLVMPGPPRESVQLCKNANQQSAAALEGLQWQAVTGMTAWYDVVQESLLGRPPDQVEATFAALKDGLGACLGVPTQDSHGRTLISEPYDVTTSGDAHFATRDRYEDGAIVTNILVRKGAILAHMTMAKGISMGPGGEPETKTFPDHVIRQVVEIALEKLP